MPCPSQTTHPTITWHITQLPTWRIIFCKNFEKRNWTEPFTYIWAQRSDTNDNTKEMILLRYDGKIMFKSSVTRCWNKSCPMFPEGGPKSSFTRKMFPSQIGEKVAKYLGSFVSKFVTKIFKNGPIWSRCSKERYFGLCLVRVSRGVNSDEGRLCNSNGGDFSFAFETSFVQIWRKMFLKLLLPGN